MSARATLLVARAGARVVAVPAEAVERVERMAALTPLPDPPAGVAGVLDLRGEILPVVDPRPWLGLATPAAHPDQRLLVVRAGSRYLLWVDEVEQTVDVAAPDLDPVAVSRGQTVIATRLARIQGEMVPILSPDALDPGRLARPAASTG